MIEAYKIGVNIALTGGIQQQIAALTKDFATLNAAVKNIQISVNEMASGMRGLQRIGTSAAAAWTATAVAMERAARASNNFQRAANANAAPVATQATGTNGGGSRALTYAGAGLVAGIVGGGGRSSGPPAPPTSNVLRLPGNGRNGGMPPILPPSSGAVPSYPSSHDFMIAGAAAAGVSAGIFSAGQSAFAAGAEIAAMKMRMKLSGYSDAQINQAMDVARQQTGPNGVPGLTQIGALRTMLDVRTITGSPDAGAQALPAFARLGLVLGAGGKGDQVNELYSAIQAGELRGAIVNPQTHAVDPDRLVKFVSNLQSAAIATGFRYGPREILQTLRSGGISASALSDQALFADQVLPTLTLGAAGGGTALQGFGMQFGAGKMSEAAGNILAEMGIIDLHGGSIKDFKTGIGQINLPPGVLKDRENAISNPADFITKTLVPGIDRYLISKGITPNDQERMIAAQQVASRIPGGKYVADFIRLLPIIDRERAQFAAAQGRNGYDIRLQSDPNLQVQAMNAAFHNMMAEFGGAMMNDAMKGMQMVTSGLQALSKWAAEHPDTATRITEVAAALGALAGSVAVISAALVAAGPVLSVGRYLNGAASATASAIGVRAAASAGLSSLARYSGPLAFLATLFDSSGIRPDADIQGLAAQYAAQHPAGPDAPAGPRRTGSVQDPLHVIIANPRDVGDAAARGTMRGLTNTLSGPPVGPSSPDIRVNPYVQAPGP